METWLFLILGHLSNAILSLFIKAVVIVLYFLVVERIGRIVFRFKYK